LLRLAKLTFEILLSSILQAVLWASVSSTTIIVLLGRKIPLKKCIGKFFILVYMLCSDLVARKSWESIYQLPEIFLRNPLGMLHISWVFKRFSYGMLVLEAVGMEEVHSTISQALKWSILSGLYLLKCNLGEFDTANA